MAQNFGRNQIPRNEKGLKHFWKYYKFHVIIWAIGLGLLGWYIYNTLTAPSYSLNGIFLNTVNSTDELKQSYELAQGITDGKDGVNLEDKYSYTVGENKDSKKNYKASEAIITQKEEEELDFVAGPLDSIIDIAYNAYFEELTTTLNPEELALYKPHFLYIDLDVVEQLEKAYDDEKDLSTITIPDPKKPENMKSPVAVLIDISASEEIAKIYGADGETIAFGIISEAPHKQETHKLLRYLFE